jgi:hypothetical protein
MFQTLAVGSVQWQDFAVGTAERRGFAPRLRFSLVPLPSFS